MQKKIKQLLLILLISIGNLYAQNESPQLIDESSLDMDYETAMDSIFGQLDKSKISTGLLKERSYTFMQWDNYMGKDTSKACNKDEVLELYSELYYAKFAHTPEEKLVSELDSAAKSYYKQTGYIPLMIVDYSYNQFRGGVFENGLLKVEGMQLMEVGTPRAEELYTLNRLFAFSPLKTDLPFKEEGYNFVLTEDFILTNNLEDISAIYIDFGDGLGERLLNVGEPVNANISGETREMRIKLRIIKGGNEVIGYGSMAVLRGNGGGIRPNDLPDLPVPNSDLVHQFGIWYGCDKDLENPCLRKPIVLVDGYDPPDRRKINPDEIELAPGQALDESPNYLYNVVNQQGMADRLREAGYDLVILNYDSEKGGLLSIQDKAKVVQELTRIIRQRQAVCGSNHEIVWIGPSEGALVVRFALAEMEENGEDHHTRIFISFDGPNQGANLPLAIQYYLDMLHDAIPPLHFQGIMTKGVNALPTKQMLRFHHKNFPSNAPEFTQFQNELHQLNGGTGYPQKCRKVVISNGSALAEDQGFQPNDKMFAYNLTLPLFNIFGLSSVYADGWAMPNGGSNVKIFSGTAWKHFGIVPIPFIIRIKKVSNTPPIDNAPGGRANFSSLVASSFTSSLPGITQGLFQANLPVPDTFQNFIPLISALDLQNTNNMFFQANTNLSMVSDNNGGFERFHLVANITPFDAVYVEDRNDNHVIDGVTAGIADFVQNEVMPVDLKLQNRTITNYSADFEGTHTVEIGSNVISPRYEQGKFITDVGAKVKINAGNSISLRSGFVAKQGSTVKFSIEKLDSECELRRSGQPNIAELNGNETITPNISVAENGNNSLKCYPNPFSSILNVGYQLEKEGNVRIKLVDMMGNLLMVKETNYQQSGVYTQEFNTLNLANGLCFVLLEINGKIEGVSKVQLIK